LYWRLPVRFQEAALSAYARYLERRYYGVGYEYWLKEFRNRQTWSLIEGERWQVKRLRQVLEVAARSVSYYRQSLKHVDVDAIRCTADLARLPLVEKQSIRQNEAQFLAEGLKKESLWLQKTSGTTGTALAIFWPLAMLPQFWAMMEVMVRNVARVGQGIPRAMMGGRPVVRGRTTLPPYWRFNRRWRQLYLSSYHVSARTAPLYVSAIRRYESEWMTGYGSAIAALAESALEAGLEPVPLRAVITSGDTLLPSMRQSIEAFFKCKCFDHYGQSEGVAMAMECPYGRMHVIPSLGIVEILRRDNTPCAPGEVGEIVATGLMNDAMPLIRYRLGDCASWAPEESCPCGNQQRVLTSLEGRVDDYLVTADGRKIGRLSTALKRSPSVHSAQIVQERPGRAWLLIRPSNGYRRADALAIRDDIIEKVGDLEIEILEVAEIPKTPQGKNSLVVRLDERPVMLATYERLLHGSGDHVP